MANEQELLALLRSAIEQCTVEVPNEAILGGSYSKCPWCHKEAMYNGHDDEHHPECLYYKILAVFQKYGLIV